MKKTSITIAFLLSNTFVWAQNIPTGVDVPSGSVTNIITPPTEYSLGATLLYNYIKTYVPDYQVTDETLINDAYNSGLTKERTIYFDGFGNKMEKIDRYASPATDLITAYDNVPSTNHFSYLPYPRAANNSAFDQTPFTNQASYYSTNFSNDGATAMSENLYQSNSSGFYNYSYAPGISNVGQENGSKSTVSTNVTNEVIMWSLDPTSGWPKKTGYYTAGTLVKKVVTNADGQSETQFFDNENKLICKSILSSVSTCSLVTYETDPDVGYGYVQAKPVIPQNPTTTTTAIYPFYLGLNVYDENPNVPPSQNSLLAPPSANTTSPWRYPNPDPTYTSNCPTYLQTYYVYDIYDRIAYVLHPKAVEYLALNDWLPNTNIIQNLCDYRQYDNIGRIISIHKAGENGSENVIYDNHNRPVLRANPADPANTWRWSHYDKVNRVIETGDVTSTYAMSVMATWFNTATLPAVYNTSSSVFYYLYNDNQQGVYAGSTSAPLASGTDILSYNFYDNYNYSNYYDGTSAQPISFSYDPSIFSGATSSGTTAMPALSTPSTKTNGKLTYSVEKVIYTPGSLTTLNNYISSAYYYDDRGEIVEKNDLNAWNGLSKTGQQYDYIGNILANINVVNNPRSTTDPTTTTAKEYSYNALGLSLTSVSESINGGIYRELADYAYNQLGQISTKNIGGSVEYQGYTYNIRGQLTGINPDFAEYNIDYGNPISFGEALKYDAGFTHTLYCGKVAGIIWRTKGSTEQAYGYTYDYAGRLLQSDFREFSLNSSCGRLPGIGYGCWNNAVTDYTEGNISYDLNDNMTGLVRYGPLASGTPGQIDNLTYTYQASDISNNLQAVNDAINVSTTTATDYDFKDNNKTSTDYSYDYNGNLTTDLNKTTTTSYFFFNKPDQITFTNGDYIRYSYDAGGNKLEDLHYIHSTGVTTITDYIGDAIYTNTGAGSMLSTVNTQEGYASKDRSGFDYYFYVKDHLGNVRTTLQSLATSTDIAMSPTHTSVTYLATHEDGAAASEDAIFENIDTVSDYKPGSISPEDVKAAHLDAAYSDRIIGTTLVLKVMAGDSFSIAATSYYPSGDTALGNLDSSDFASALLSAMSGSASGAISGEGYTQNIMSGLFTANNIALYNSITGGNINPSIPQAFINYIMYDENFNVVPGGCGKIQIAAGANVWQTIGTGMTLPISTNGYLAVYMSTSTEGIPVYMDDMDVEYIVGHLMDVNHYYPFGLPVNLSTALTAHPVNNYLYQTQQQDKTDRLYLHDFHARQYDPQLGRFCGIDAWNQYPSGYTGMGNNPISLIDPSGNGNQDKNLEDPDAPTSTGNDDGPEANKNSPQGGGPNAGEGNWSISTGAEVVNGGTPTMSGLMLSADVYALASWHGFVTYYGSSGAQLQDQFWTNGGFENGGGVGGPRSVVRDPNDHTKVVTGGMTFSVNLFFHVYSISFVEDVNNYMGIYFTHGGSTDIIGASSTIDVGVLWGNDMAQNQTSVADANIGSSNSISIGEIGMIGVTQGYNGGPSDFDQYTNTNNQITTFSIGGGANVGVLSPVSVNFSQTTTKLVGWQSW